MANIAAAREVLAVTAVFLAMLVVAGVAVLLYRRRYLGTASSEQSMGFTLADVRRMYKEGQISDQEYARMRESVLAGVSRHSEKAAGERDRPNERRTETQP